MTLDQLIKNYKQHEVDFVLPKIIGDTSVYLDLYLLYESPDKRWHKVQRLTYDYLNFYFKKYSTKKISNNQAIELLSFPEVPYIALGHCKKGIQGRGSANERAEVLKDYLFDNEEVKKIDISALANMSISIGGIGPDLMSDMIANIGMHYLLEYTAEQVKIFGLDTREYPIRKYLKYPEMTWRTLPKVSLPYFNKTGEPRIFVPKHIARRLPVFSTDGFFKNYLQYFLTEERQDRLQTLRTLGKKPKVTIKEVTADISLQYGSIGEATREIAIKNPELIEKYIANPTFYKVDHTRKVKDKIKWNKYKKELEQIPTGDKHARKYAEFLRKIFTALYGKNLVNGQIEDRSEDGLYSYDVNFANSADTPLFRMIRNHGIKAGLLIIEAKNYGKTKVGNTQFNQANGYTIQNARELVFLAKRAEITDKDIARARRHYLSHKVLILPISDEDLKFLIRNRAKTSEDFDFNLVQRAQEIMKA